MTSIEQAKDLFISTVSSIDWHSAAGILFGAAISATVSYLLQRNSFAENRRQKDQDKREERRTLGLNVFTKMIRIASTLELLKLSLENSFSRAKAQGIDAPPWAVVIPMANFPSKVHFEPRELTEILRLDFNLFNTLGPFDDVHNALIEGFQTYRADRNNLTSAMKAEMNGAVGAIRLSAEEMKTLGPQMAALNILIDNLLKRSTEDSKEAWEILSQLQKSLNNEYRLKLDLQRKPFEHQDN